MTDIARLITDMVSEGVSAEIIGRVAAALAEREPVLLKDDQAERRRMADRERKQRLPLDWELRRLKVFARDNYTCQYCGFVGAASSLHCDHIFALSRGGSSELSNLTTACARCNVRKKDRLVENFQP
jgi:5-methylcytosine-specific restriction endonuclease McrA